MICIGQENGFQWYTFTRFLTARVLAEETEVLPGKL